MIAARDGVLFPSPRPQRPARAHWRSHIVASLHTELRDEARQRAQALAAATDRFFWEWRGMPNDKKPTTTFQTNYELGVEFDPSGNVKKILVTDAKPEEQPAIDRHIENLRASAAPRGRPD